MADNDNDNDNDSSSTIDKRKLVPFIERRERLALEAADIKEQVKELNAEIKGEGYELPYVNHVIKLRAMDPDKRANDDAMRDMYEDAVGL
jgi:uncharacterized protein (UPF0335 family)